MPPFAPIMCWHQQCNRITLPYYHCPDLPAVTVAATVIIICMLSISHHSHYHFVASTTKTIGDASSICLYVICKAWSFSPMKYHYRLSHCILLNYNQSYNVTSPTFHLCILLNKSKRGEFVYWFLGFCPILNSSLEYIF